MSSDHHTRSDAASGDEAHPIFGDVAWRAALRTAMLADDRARRLWERTRRFDDEQPDLLIACSDGSSDVVGLLIGGTRDDVSPIGWDMDTVFRLFTEDGAVVTVKGWMISDLETFRLDHETMAETRKEEPEMTPVSQQHIDSVLDRLVILCGLSQLFHQSSAAQAFWNVHLHRRGLEHYPLSPPPACILCLSEREGANVGVIVSGKWDDRCGEFDLTHPFLILNSDGCILRCESALGELVTVL